MATTGGAKPLLTGGGGIELPGPGQHGGATGGGQQGGALAVVPLWHHLLQQQPADRSVMVSSSPAPTKRRSMGVSSLTPGAGSRGVPKFRWVGGAGRDLSPR
jgi:hypothetical protein